MSAYLKSTALLFVLCAFDVKPHAAELVSVISLIDPASSASPRNSLMAFGGPMSSTTLGRTLVLNKIPATSERTFDNDIVGMAYRRDYLHFGYLIVGGEAGLADRFGHFVVCCDTQIMSSSIVQSGELWAGGTFRIEALFLNQVRIAPGITVGLSGSTNSIGREREREITENGNARLLGYLSPEVAFSAMTFPALELVLRVQHRSGAAGTLGRLFEGYNADVAGLRYRF
jgi:hypothetical protein